MISYLFYMYEYIMKVEITEKYDSSCFFQIKYMPLINVLSYEVMMFKHQQIRFYFIILYI